MDTIPRIGPIAPDVNQRIVPGANRPCALSQVYVLKRKTWVKHNFPVHDTVEVTVIDKCARICQGSLVVPHHERQITPSEHTDMMVEADRSTSRSEHWRVRWLCRMQDQDTNACFRREGLVFVGVGNFWFTIGPRQLWQWLRLHPRIKPRSSPGNESTQMSQVPRAECGAK